MTCWSRELSKIYARRSSRSRVCVDGSQIARMTGFTSTVASKGTTIIADWIRMGLYSVRLR
jgi:hypothetical protein